MIDPRNPPKKVATTRHPTIEAAISGSFRYPDLSDALARLKQLRGDFKCSAKILPTRDGAIVMWIRGYADPDEKQGFLGNFAELYAAEHPSGYWTIISEKVEAPLSIHDQRAQLYSANGLRRPHPNWGHRLLRSLDTKTYDTRELAWAALETFHSEYPQTSIPQPVHGVLNFMVFEARTDGVSGGHTRKMILFIDELVDGRFRIGIRENAAKRQKAAGPPQTALTRDQMADLQRHTISFLGLTDDADALLETRCDVTFPSASPFINTVMRIARSAVGAGPPKEGEPPLAPGGIIPTIAAVLTTKTLFGLVGQAYERREGRALYHYTRPAGLRGILQNGYLRLNDVSDMNDPTDISYGAERVTKALEALREEVPENRGQIALVDGLIASLRSRSSASRYIFFSSFSEEIDTLEMWREYAMAGEGYALALDRSGMMLKAPANTLLAKVVYQDSRVEELLEIYRTTVRNIAKNIETGSAFAPLVPAELVKFSWALAAMIKHRAYRNEKEWRLLRLVHDSDDRRDIVIEDRDHGLKPHIRGPAIAEQVLTGIFVGSALDEHQDELVGLLLEQNGFSDCEVTRSDVPLRKRRG